MLLGNFAPQNRNMVREIGVAFTNPLAQVKAPHLCACWVPDTTSTDMRLSARPHGYGHGSAWWLPRSAGGMAATSAGPLGMVGSGSLSAAGDRGLNAAANLTGSGNVSDALGTLVAALAAALSGSGGVTDAALQAFLNAVAGLSGSGGISSAQATGLADIAAALTGSGGASSALLTALGALAADIVVTGSGLSTANVGEAVWSALAASNNAPGTMGNKLNSAGSAGDPWSTLLPGSYPAGSAGALVGLMLVDVWRRLGLDADNAQTTTQAGSVTTITDGTLTLEITVNMDGSVTIQRQ